MGSRRPEDGAPFDDDRDDDGFGGPPSTMSFTFYDGDRLPQRPTGVGDDNETTARETSVASVASTTSPEEEDKTATAAAETKTADADASTFTTPVRLSSTTIDLSADVTTALSTADRTSVTSQATQTDPRPASVVSEEQSTMSTAISAGVSGTSSDDSTPTVAAGLAPGENTALPEVAAASRHAMSGGEIAAAVILPILAALAIFAALLFCRRRRKRRRDTASPSPPPFFPAMMEKMGQFRHRANSPSTISDPSTTPEPPILTSANMNHTYYTGLDTSSRPSNSSSGGGEYYAPSDPPPAYYDAKSPPQLPLPPLVDVRLSEPEPVARGRSPFEDPTRDLDTPVSPLEDTRAFPSDFDGAAQQQTLSPLSPAAAVAAGALGAGVSRTHSFSSTQYSDTASVHSARAARRSVAGPLVVMGRGSIGSMGRPSSGEADVFEDPVSPVSSVGGGEGRGRR